ncbi:hypothetical protein [Nocardia seriolae]|uniref:Uncharacterized protein n=1 Tax=Nocardia seriolae TaxID=37332 RepID=A0ABC8AU42_9NOCA|nr:hypothetical protein [Nocardia seriolae]APA97608.1 hypothetical protein NS506_03556 [Nocardia seriolae]OJF81460.1 hypothetical protein NS14008_22635 [Nocardia seriolae]PSK27614.1 hypothetical protein C6575_31010 [Nocardia seriolae]QOW34535.1 hypothetical protein IMZ23_05565 [Nocardia seriolae]QUN18004.1 hypothetical protein KEC46_00470 [Nocardia seriolae]
MTLLTVLIARIEPCQMGTYVLWARTKHRTWRRIAEDLCVSTPTVLLWAGCAQLRHHLHLPTTHTIEELH